jgi:hypothetical protein
MSATRLLLGAALLAAPLGAGCDGASSARETVAASSKPDPTTTAVVATAAAPQQPAKSVAIKPDPSLPQRDAAGVLESSFDDVRFEMDKTAPFDRALLTPKVKALFGDRIRIRGYMYPTLRKRGLKQFVLVRDNLECCFGPGAALYDCILVTMQEGKTAEFSIRPIAVEGKFRLDEFKGPDGQILAIYQMEGEAVK